MDKINVIDSIMGSGKTSWAIQYMNEAPAETRFIYITPFLDEIQRVKSAVKNRIIYEPDIKNDEGRKMRSLKQLIADGQDIASTHSLFRAADAELIELIRSSNYVLILDEVMQVIDNLGVKRDDILTLLESKRIGIDENHRVHWLRQDYEEGKFTTVKMTADAGNLYLYRKSFIVWTFPPAAFKAFKNVYVMTYLFEGQLQRAYFDLFDIPFQYLAIKQGDDQRYSLTKYCREAENRKKFMELMTVYEGKYNNVGDGYYEFSSTKLRNYSDQHRKKIKTNTAGFFKHKADARKDEIMWTTLKEKKDTKNGYGGPGYARGEFVEWNKRATNEYRDKRALAYLFNRFTHPDETVFFEENKIPVNEEVLALSDLLQWIYRSRIRDDKPIHLYIPSSRMRGLLKSWGKYEI
ncbi:hypothetical protein MM300_16220 [Evansella sp. LMS18]|uniref:hypothetical protein n=1 Tax=Evansella sp. LMS18 TaxID=2924033 RepID=UPI0020D0A5A9|nr:hypothetical protein [Evansella sp. LMS18]UTR09430.1 hypothetical protein MM300_16220 [Evansella sp. LMS18]